jgi:hypothetical protein
MATGIPTGTVKLVEHPVESVKEMGKATWHDWSPLFHGHFGQFGHQFYAHPLAPILDVASVLTLGAGSGARAAKALSEAGRVGESSRIARFGSFADRHAIRMIQPDDRPALPKSYSKNPASLAAEQHMEKLSNHLAEHLPSWWGNHVFGETARYNRLKLKDTFTRKVAMQQQVTTMIAAAKKLEDPAEREKLMRHAYDQLNTMAFEHDASQAIPKGYRTVDKIPTVGAVKASLSKVNNAHARLSGLGGNLKKHFGVDVNHMDRSAIASSLKSVQAELRKADSAAAKASETRFKHGPHAAKADALRLELQKANEDLARMNAKGFRVKSTDKGKHRGFKALERQQAKVESLVKQYEKAAQSKVHFDTATKAGPDIAKQQESLVRQRTVLKKMLATHGELSKLDKAHGKIADAHIAGHSDFFRVRGDFEHEMRSFGGRYTSRPMKNGMANMSKAVTKDGGKKVLIVPSDTLKRYEIEGARSSAALKYLYHKPTHVWKSIILGYTPRYLVNNAVGNTAMYLMSEGGGAGFRSYVDALRQTKREGSVIKDLKSADDLTKFSWQDKWFKGQLNNTLGHSTLSSMVNSGKKSKLREGLFPVTHRWADQVLRRATLIKAMREEPMYKLYRKEGLSDEAAANRVMHLDAQDGGVIRRKIEGRVEHTLGDYHTMNEAERKIRQIVPFYAWDRHIMRFSKHMVKEHTTRVNAMAKTGQLGADETRKILGEIPGFLTGALPLSMLGVHVDHHGRKAILTTQGLNPFATVSDIYDAGRQATVGGSGRPGESVGALVNPLLGGAMEALTGHSMISDAPAKRHGGAITTPYINALLNLPYVKLADHLLHGADHPKRNKRTHKKTPFMYEKNAQTDLLSLLGFPVKQYSPKRGAEQAKKEK